VRISHYDLLQPIGRDGASEIFRARDLKLDREVAVKLLRSEEISRPGAVELFRREARLASLVSHPHVCAVHEWGEESGQPFLVCELLEGRALDEIIAGRPLPNDRLLDIAVQLADALNAIHRRGLVHGGLKPSNVFITNDGHVKVLELGAVGAAAPERPRADAGRGSQTTTVDISPPRPVPVGNLFHAYLAPEQISGSGADYRADIFSLGALLYEMATGRPAFSGETPAQTAAAITGRQPAHPRSLNRAMPAGLGRIIMRALAKDPAQRYQSAGDVFNDLKQARHGTVLLDRLPSRLRSRPALIAAIAGGVLVAAAALALAGRGSSWWASPTQRSLVLVGHIANGTADPDFDGTLREAVTVYLSQSPYLDIVSDERVRSTMQLMGRESSERMTHEVAHEVCQRLGLQAMLDGSVSAVGSATVVALAATDCSTGATIARRQVDVARKEDVLRAMGTITAEVREALGESRDSLARHNVPIEEATTPSMDALKAYTEGTQRRAAGRETDAIPFFERAIALDPRFALAYTTLSTLYGGLGETSRSEELARLAYGNREHVSERERLFITYQYHDRFTGDQTRAQETLQVWKRTYPRDYRPANALAVLFNRLGEYQSAAAEAEEAIRRNPAHAFPQSNLAYALRGAGRFDRAREVAAQAVAKNLSTGPLRRLLYQLSEMQGDEQTARAQLEWAATSSVGFDFTGARAQIAAFRGRMTEARKLYAETIAAADAQGFAQIGSGYAAQAALTEAVYGFQARAAATALKVVQSATANEPRLRAATALALAGGADEADLVIRKLRSVRPDDTLLHAAYLPAAEAAVLIERGQAAAAVEALRPAVRYERGIVAALIPAYLRGEARLRAGSPAEAAREFKVVIDNRGADPFSPIVPLAHLGLARALARAGDTTGGRAAYDAVLRIWFSADADLPPLIAARQEAAALVR
jgi:serine/threonine protein kinase/tetratricopeptide (TPR) repeat protein